MQLYALASEIILTTLGPDWWKRHTLEDGEHCDLMYSSATTPSGMTRHFAMMVHLADALYRFKLQDNFANWVVRLREKTFRGAFFEAEAARLLVPEDGTIQFVTQTYQKGRDYDLEINRGDYKICVEVKIKTDTARPSYKAICNHLNKARKQLPRDQASLVALFIPVSWTQTPLIGEVLQEAASALFRATSRLNFVYVIWSDVIQTTRIDRGLVLPGWAQAYKFRLYRNEHARHPVPPPIPAQNRQTFGYPKFWIDASAPR